MDFKKASQIKEAANSRTNHSALFQRSVREDMDQWIGLDLPKTKKVPSLSTIHENRIVSGRPDWNPSTHIDRNAIRRQTQNTSHFLNKYSTKHISSGASKNFVVNIDSCGLPAAGMRHENKIGVAECVRWDFPQKEFNPKKESRWTNTKLQPTSHFFDGMPPFSSRCTDVSSERDLSMTSTYSSRPSSSK